jgi:hypothetical protein
MLFFRHLKTSKPQIFLAIDEEEKGGNEEKEEEKKGETRRGR